MTNAAQLARAAASLASVTCAFGCPLHHRYTIPGRQHRLPRTARCDCVIAAFPHIKKNLAAFDLDAQESAVFDLVRQVQYYSGVINLPKSSKGRFVRLLKLTGDEQEEQPKLLWWQQRQQQEKYKQQP